MGSPTSQRLNDFIVGQRPPVPFVLVVVLVLVLEQKLECEQESILWNAVTHRVDKALCSFRLCAAALAHVLRVLLGTDWRSNADFPARSWSASLPNLKQT